MDFINQKATELTRNSKYSSLGHLLISRYLTLYEFQYMQSTVAHV